MKLPDACPAMPSGMSKFFMTTVGVPTKLLLCWACEKAWDTSLIDIGIVDEEIRFQVISDDIGLCARCRKEILPS